MNEFELRSVRMRVERCQVLRDPVDGPLDLTIEDGALVPVDSECLLHHGGVETEIVKIMSSGFRC